MISRLTCRPMAVRSFVLPALSAAILLAVPARANEAVIGASKDNTLFQTSGTPLSNGMGDAIFSGRIGNFGDASVRRGVLAFDVAGAIPPGATITSAALTLRKLQASPGSGNRVHAIHRLLADWGEGTSVSFGGQGAPATEDDATWIHTFFPDSFWATPGGDFVATPSATQVINETPGVFHTFGSTTQMVADVQLWLDDPDASFGWILFGDEDDLNTARRFASRDNEDPDSHPVLVVQYETCVGDVTRDGVVGFDDLLEVLSFWGPYEPCPPYIAQDIDQNCDVGFDDLLTVLSFWGDCIPE